jgi:hypothetical protein
MSTQETIPRPPVRLLSLYPHLPADGRWEGGETPPARLNAAPVHRPARQMAAGFSGQGRASASRSENPPRSPSTVRTTKDPIQLVVTEAEIRLCVQLGWRPGRVAPARRPDRPGRAHERPGFEAISPLLRAGFGEAQPFIARLTQSHGLNVAVTVAGVGSGAR